MRQAVQFRKTCHSIRFNSQISSDFPIQVNWTERAQQISTRWIQRSHGDHFNKNINKRINSSNLKNTNDNLYQLILDTAAANISILTGYVFSDSCILTYHQKWHIHTSNVTSVIKVQSASTRLFAGMWQPLVSVITTLLCFDYFSSTSVESHAFSALCVCIRSSGIILIL